MRVYLTLCSREDRSHKYSLDVLRSIFGFSAGSEIYGIIILGNEGKRGYTSLARGDLITVLGAKSEVYILIPVCGYVSSVSVRSAPKNKNRVEVPLT